MILMLTILSGIALLALLVVLGLGSIPDRPCTRGNYAPSPEYRDGRPRH